jgi:NADPH:quinone reductase-like Zn-dependent oxidoreductase
MQVITVGRFGGPEVMQVGEAGMPEPGPGEVLVRVLAAGVGPWDGTLRRGGWSGSLPYVPGGEFAGVVVGETGADADFDDGAPVYGYPSLTGCYAQYVTCPVEQLAPIPGALTAAEAAGVPIDALTAEQGLTDVLEVGPGDRVLITAGAGGLGHFAVQIARNLGAEVVATASPQHHEFLHRLGAAVVIDHTRADWPEQVRDAIDGGAGKVLACVAPTLEGAARAARDGALIATPVHAELPLPAADRVRWQQYNGQPRGSRLVRMAPWFEDGSLSVNIQARYFWHNAAEAQREVERGHTQGKIVLIVDEDLAAGMEV